MKNDRYIGLIKEYSKNSYKKLMRSAQGQLTYPFIVPGSSSYHDSLWDWDSWLTDVAIRQIMLDNADDNPEFVQCERRCILNFLDHTEDDGRIPIMVNRKMTIPIFEQCVKTNIHKPCLAQHAAFLAQQDHGQIDWLLPYVPRLRKFVDYYMSSCFHQETGLFYWIDDIAIGVDNDPCTFFRPNESSASILLNCMMYKELKAMDYICELTGNTDKTYQEAADRLRRTINELMWDERNGFYYSVDLNLKPIEHNKGYHSGMPRHWSSVIQKIDVWSGFLAMWAGIADIDRAKRMVKENLINRSVFCSPYGIRTLGKNEQMYRIVKSGNPSCWLGPIWGISNYMCFKGLVDYGFTAEATELAEGTVALFGADIDRNGEMHEYYHPDTGEGVNNSGFQSWNLLVNNMIAWLEGKQRVVEF